MRRFLAILEVSQKQAYIFGSNKVEDNIVNSAIIAKCLSPNYIASCLGDEYSKEKNLVYAGGGHTILEYEDRESMKKAISIISMKIYKDFSGLEVFAKILEYDELKTPEENLKTLTAELEKKKAMRRAGFHHGSFGVEKIDVNTLKPIEIMDNKGNERKNVKDEEYGEASVSFTPEGYSPTYRFGDLGMDKGDTNFIAVVHIDGNGMGKRVNEFYAEMEGKDNWESVKKNLKAFSNGIDRDFKGAYLDMVNAVKESHENGALKDKLNLIRDKNGEYCFPVRRIITAGDDICFVTEGRIGIECARIFIEELTDENRKNCADGKGYSACAGVAIVHQKYPFYRAYELAEALCSKAKKEGAKLSPDDDGRSVSAIDWHVEFGEMKDSLDEIKKDYISDDGSSLTLRPYLVKPEAEVLNCDEERNYAFFKKMVQRIQNEKQDFGVGKIKELRGVMKKGVAPTDHYLTFYKMKNKLPEAEFVPCEGSNDNKMQNKLFDAIEIMDTFLEV